MLANVLYLNKNITLDCYKSIECDRKCRMNRFLFVISQLIK